MLLVPKLRLSFLFISIYHKQFGQRISIPYFPAISIISSSHFIFPTSLNPADIITTLFIHFFQQSVRASFTLEAGIANTAISTTTGKSKI
jgi:hypothetical protein